MYLSELKTIEGEWGGVCVWGGGGGGGAVISDRWEVCYISHTSYREGSGWAPWTPLDSRL